MSVGELESTGVLHSDEDAIISPWLHFQGLGIGPNIPLYLRAHGNICNLNFSKKECEMYVNDIWLAKSEYEEDMRLSNKAGSEEGDEEENENLDAARSNKIHLSDFFKIFLEV